MGSHPTLYELERAILCYTSPSVKSGLQEWQAMEWLWKRLTWSARLVTHFGASGAVWWKERYIFPLLCEEGTPFLQQFLCGEWTRAEEESLRYCFHFFSPYAIKNPSLFPPEITGFVSETCPSFHYERELFQAQLVEKGLGKSCSWLRDETFAHYRSRLRSMIERPSSRKVPQRVEREPIEVQALPDIVKDMTREKAKRLFEHMSAMRDEVAQLVSHVDRDLAKAFPIRQEAEGEIAEFQNVKEDLVTLLLEIDSALHRLPDHMSCRMSNTEACRSIKDGDKDLKAFQNYLSDLRSRGEKHVSALEDIRALTVKRLQIMTRALDHIPMLESTRPFRMQQARLVRMAREKVKCFRMSLSKGSGPEGLLRDLENEIFALEGLARAFYNEGAEIATMKEHLQGFEHRIQKMLTESIPVSSGLSLMLRKVLADVVEFKGSLEVVSDRKYRFENIVRDIYELGVQKS